MSRIRWRHLAAAVALMGARVWLHLAPGQAVRWASLRGDKSFASEHAQHVHDVMARAVLSVSVRGPLTFSCLEQGLALVTLLATRRTPARLVIGVNRAPFAAHAWVECDSRILLGGSGAHRMTPLTGTAASPCRG